MQIEGRNNDIMDVDALSGRGLVDSKSRPSEEVEAVDGNAFIFHGRCHTAAAASGGLMYFKNTSDTKEVVITRIYVDPQTLTPTDLLVTQIKQPTTVTSGTDISTSVSQGKTQKNYGKGKGLTGTLVISDGSANLTFTGGQRYHSVPLVSRTSIPERDMKGTNVIAPNTTILWGWETEGGGNAVDAEIISLSVNCFIRDIPEGA